MEHKGIPVFSHFQIFITCSLYHVCTLQYSLCILLPSILESFDTMITIMELEKLLTPYPQVIVHFSISLGCKALWEKKRQKNFFFHSSYVA